MADPNLAGAVPDELPWHAAFPAPKSTAAGLPREKLLSWLLEGKVPGKDFVLVDLRRNDYKAGSTSFVCRLFSLCPGQTLT